MLQTCLWVESLYSKLTLNNTLYKTRLKMHDDGAEDWEFVADLSDDDNYSNKDGNFNSEFPALGALQPTNQTEKPHRAFSMPEFGSIECCSLTSSDMSIIEEDVTSIITGISESPIAISAPKNICLAGEKPVHIQKKLSFRDMILLNAEEKLKEQKAKEDQARQLTRHPHAARKKFSPKFVVKKIERSTHSTGDLVSLATIHDDEELLACGLGGGGGGIPQNSGHDENFGTTDAQDFYSRKDHGAKTHRNGLRSRPDEAKRKEISLYKKNLQREEQRARGRQ